MTEEIKIEAQKKEIAKEYAIPDPKQEPIKCLVLAYKVTKGVPYDDRPWDKVHFARASKSAKALFEICESLRVADQCLLEVSQNLEDAGLSWSLETIVKFAHEWLAKKRGPSHGNTHRARFFEALNERRRGYADSSLRPTEEPLSNPRRSIQDPKEINRQDPNGK